MSTFSHPDLPLLIEELAANAWPALVQQQIGRWRLRASQGVTRRANSVLPLGEMPPHPQWMADVADFYHSRGLPIRYQISAASPPELDPLLESHGYSVEAATEVQVAECSEVHARSSAAAGHEVALEETPTEEWLEHFARIEEIAPAKLPVYRQALNALDPRACYAAVSVEGEVVGIGRAVAERGWAGLFGIATTAQRRREGIGTEVVRALAGWAAGAGAGRLYLQVMDGNAPAIALYKKLGFTNLYTYHFRIEPRG